MNDENRRSPRKWPLTGIWTETPVIECDELWTPEKPKSPEIERAVFAVKVEGFVPRIK